MAFVATEGFMPLMSYVGPEKKDFIAKIPYNSKSHGLSFRTFANLYVRHIKGF